MDTIKEWTMYDYEVIRDDDDDDDDVEGVM